MSSLGWVSFGHEPLALYSLKDIALIFPVVTMDKKICSIKQF